MNDIYNELYNALKPHVKHSVWVLSDLQQSHAENAKHCLDITLEDFELLNRPAEQIWYLGDSVERWDLDHLYRMTDMQVEGFGKLGIPLCYATGNHDYDYMRYHAEPSDNLTMPFYQAVQKKEGWLTTKDPEDFYFRTELGDYAVYFLCDHISRKNEWLVTHSRIIYGADKYPYTQKDADELREKIASEKKVITASHYAFPGGNRDSFLMSKLTPLPSNVMIHFYGHAHMGDFDWAGKDAFRRICWVDFEDIPQIDVASMENIRGAFCRSALFQIYDDDTMGIFFRNHDSHTFTEAYFPARIKQPETVSQEKRSQLYSRYMDTIRYIFE